MNIDLIKNKYGNYEIWAGKDFIKEIKLSRNEPITTFQKRAEAEFDDYVEKMKNFKASMGGSKPIKRVEI